MKPPPSDLNPAQPNIHDEALIVACVIIRMFLIYFCVVMGIILWMIFTGFEIPEPVDESTREPVVTKTNGEWRIEFK